MVRARSGSLVALVLVVFSIACPPLLQPISCLPINLAGTAPTLPKPPASHKDGSLLSGKDFLSVFVASRIRHTSQNDATGDRAAPDNDSLPTPPFTPPDSAAVPTEDVVLLQGPQDDPIRSPTVVSVRVSSSVGGGRPVAVDRGWDRREQSSEDGQVDRQLQPAPTPQSHRGIFTSFLEAFAGTSESDLGKPVVAGEPPPTPPTSEPTGSQLAATDVYENKPAQDQVEAAGSNVEQMEESDDVQISSIPPVSSPFTFPDRLGFGLQTPAPPTYPSAVSAEQGNKPEERTELPPADPLDLREFFEQESPNSGFHFPRKEENAAGSGVPDVPPVTEERPTDSTSTEVGKKEEGVEGDRGVAKAPPLRLPQTPFTSLHSLDTNRPDDSQDHTHEMAGASTAHISVSTNIPQRRDQKSLYRRYLRPRYPVENDFYRTVGRTHRRGPEPRFGSYHHPGEPAETNYEVSEEVSVASRGRVHGPQPLGPSLSTPPPPPASERGPESQLQSNQKFGYVVEGRNYRKYRVEERTSDGFIVGEYGVVNHEDGVLRGVRYTADGTINPRLIHEALIKFLSL